MKKKTLWIILGAVLVVGIAAALFFLLFQPKQTLYYNLDGAVYQDPANSAHSVRKPDEDGIYWLDFAVGGKTETYHTTDKALVDYADFLSVSTLKVSSSGELLDVYSPKKPISNQDTIQQIYDGHLLMNSSFAYNGKQFDLPLAENCRFYDLANGGADTQPEIMDEILAYANSKGEATDVFILRRTPETKLYWRMVRCFDYRNQTTTRKPDENGDYSITFACEGENMKLKCKDPLVVAAIDTPEASSGAMGLIFDENDYIIEVLPGYRALHGRELCNGFNVTEIDADKFTVVNKQYSDFGRTYHLTLDPECKIYDVSNGAVVSGQEVDSLQIGDRVTVFADPMGIATHIFINIRVTGSKLYYNMVRAYSGNRTLRQPDANGWYSFQMVCDGELVTLRTNDIAIANKVDSYYVCAMGLELEGDVIKRVYSVDCVTGSDATVSDRYVFTYNESMIIHCNQGLKSPQPLLLHPDVQICDISDMVSVIPNVTPTVGDRITAFRNENGEATHIFITKNVK